MAHPATRVVAGATDAPTRGGSQIDSGGMPARPGRTPFDAGSDVPIEHLRVAAYTIPTDEPESDGTLAWADTTIVIVEVRAGGMTGLGYTYAGVSAAQLADSVLRPIVEGRDAFDVPGAWMAMVDAVRNLGRGGVAATAISAVDNALWDLKARLLDVPVTRLLGRARDSVPAYGSGGFTSYPDWRLARQLGTWVANGFAMVKMKIGREPEADPGRVAVAREAVGTAELFVDANGAYHRSTAIATAAWLGAADVRWFEEPVTSDDPPGLRAVRDRAPGGLAVAAGEYGWDAFAFRRLLEAEAVDVLQADATRCLGTTGFLQAASLCVAYATPLSTHCAPSLHAHLACAVTPAVHVEWFHDHVRIEHRLFDGAPIPVDGRLVPDPTAPGFGLALRSADAAPFLAWSND